MTEKIENAKENKNHQMTFSDFDQLKLKSFTESLFNIMEKGTASSFGEEGSYSISFILFSPDGFEFKPTTYQPAFGICKKISECQSAFR